MFSFKSVVHSTDFVGQMQYLIALVMCEAIKEYHQKTGIKIGFKPAGGINTVNDAIIYYTIVKELLGEEWLDNQLFRLGTSRLANLLLSDIKGEEIKFF